MAGGSQELRATDPEGLHAPDSAGGDAPGTVVGCSPPFELSLRRIPLALPQMVRQSRDELLRRNPKRIADAQQREYGARASRLNHLPVADGKAVADHVLLAELALRPVR